MTPQEIRKLVDNFAAEARILPGAMSWFEDEVYRCDQAMGDIRHFVENNSTNRSQNGKLIRLLREYSQRRREAKDSAMVLKSLADLIDHNKHFFDSLDKVRAEMKKQSNFIESERHYNPRVLHDLFNVLPKETAISAAFKNSGAK